MMQAEKQQLSDKMQVDETVVFEDPLTPHYRNSGSPKTPKTPKSPSFPFVTVRCREPSQSGKTLDTHLGNLQFLNQTLMAHGVSRLGLDDRHPFTITQSILDGLKGIYFGFEFIPVGTLCCIAALARGCRFGERCTHCFTRKPCLGNTFVDYEGQQKRLLDFFPCDANGAIKYQQVNVSTRQIFQNREIEEIVEGQSVTRTRTFPVASDRKQCRHGTACRFREKCAYWHTDAEIASWQLQSSTN
jgi:hypothetical protein